MAHRLCNQVRRQTHDLALHVDLRSVLSEAAQGPLGRETHANVLQHVQRGRPDGR